MPEPIAPQAPQAPPAPEGAGPAQPPEGQGGLRRALLVVGLSCVSAVVLGVWLVLPMLGRAHDHSETYAVGSCRAYAGSQTIYHRNDWDHDRRLSYAHPFTLMSTCADGTAGGSIRLLDEAFAAASSPQTPKHGYWFKDMETIGGRPIDWSRDFALCAMPAKYGGARRRTFLVSTAGTVWGKDLGKSGFVADFPADPAREGWRIAE